MTEPVDAGRSTEPMQLTTHHRWRWILAAVLVVPILGFTLYSGLALKWDYSNGTRAGVLQKLSRKGWLCKTWEGELAMTTVPGVAPTLWEFSVRDADVAARVNAMVGRRVTLHYTEHRGVPTTCFGDTQFYADSVAAIP